MSAEQKKWEIWNLPSLLSLQGPQTQERYIITQKIIRWYDKAVNSHLPKRMTHSRNTLRWVQKEITGKNHKDRNFAGAAAGVGGGARGGPQGEWGEAEKGILCKEKLVAEMRERGHCTGACVRGRIRWFKLGSATRGDWGVGDSLEESYEEGIRKAAFFSMANITFILSYSILPCVSQERFTLDGAYWTNYVEWKNQKVLSPPYSSERRP